MPARDKLIGVIGEIHRRMPRDHSHMTKIWGFRLIIDAQFTSISDKNRRRLTAAVQMCIPKNTYEGISISLLKSRDKHYLVIHAKNKQA